MNEITLNLTLEEAQGIMTALSKFTIEQAGNLYSKVQYQIAIQINALQTQVPEGPAVVVKTDSEGGSTD